MRIQFLLDIVIPVKMPSEHFEVMRNQLKAMPKGFRVNYVLDFGQNDSENYQEHINEQRANERFIEGNFGSPGLARNAGKEICDSPYLCFWDVDDCPEVSRFPEFLDRMRKDSSDIGIGNWASSDEANPPKKVTPLSVGMSPGIWRFVFRNEFVSDIEFSNLSWGEDQGYLAGVFSKNPKVLVNHETVYKYSFGTPGSLTLNRKLVRDVPNSIRILLSKVDYASGANRVCILVMIIKQSLTLFKYSRSARQLLSFLKLTFQISSVLLSKKSICAVIERSKAW